jgi:hypothetical protein
VTHDVLVVEADARERDKFLPDLVPHPSDDPRIPEQNADEGPKPAALEITIAYDGKPREYGTRRHRRCRPNQLCGEGVVHQDGPWQWNLSRSIGAVSCDSRTSQLW